MNPKTDMRTIRWTATSALALVLAACSSGGSGGTGGDFLVLRTTPPNNGKLFLNEPIRIDFSSVVDLTSADLNTVAFTVLAAALVPSTEAHSHDAGRQTAEAPALPAIRLARNVVATIARTVA